MKLAASVLSILSVLMTSGMAIAAEGEWEPSTLRPETIEKVQSTVKLYEKCVNDQTRTHLNDKQDSRRVTDLILSQCEDQLAPVKKAFATEKVPDNLSDRYMRMHRSRVAQQVVRVVMAAEAARAAETAK